MSETAGWPPDDCPNEDLCRRGIVPSSYVGCRCWFFSRGGELADDGIHCGRPPMVDGVIDWEQRWPDDAESGSVIGYDLSMPDLLAGYEYKPMRNLFARPETEGSS